MQGKIHELHSFFGNLECQSKVDFLRRSTAFRQLFVAWQKMGADMQIDARKVYQQNIFRSENCLKNRFYGALRKICRRITKVLRKNRIKLKKLAKQEIYL